MTYRFERRDNKRQKKIRGMRVVGRSIFTIVEVQRKKGKRKMTSPVYKDALLECDRIRDNDSISNLLVAYVKTNAITREEAENIWWATRRCPVPNELRKRLGL